MVEQFTPIRMPDWLPHQLVGVAMNQNDAEPTRDDSYLGAGREEEASLTRLIPSFIIYYHLDKQKNPTRGRGSIEWRICGTAGVAT